MARGWLRDVPAGVGNRDGRIQNPQPRRGGEGLHLHGPGDHAQAGRCRSRAGLYPDSRRVLLTAYADTQAAIAGINDVGLNHYLLKPWDPPDQRLYPVLDDLLSDWTAHVRLPYEGIRVAGARSSPRSYAVKEFLSSNQVPYQWIDVDEDPPTQELIRSFGDSTELPVLLFPDGSHLVAPTNRELAEKIGMQTRAHLPFYDLVIVGGGAAMTKAATYRGQDVCVVGAGNSAAQGALFFSRYARHVTVLVRGKSLGQSMSQYLVDRIAATSTIEVLTRVEVTGVCGTDRLEKVVVRRVDDAQERDLLASAIFIFIGAKPRTKMLSGLLELDEKGYVLTGPDLPHTDRKPRGWALERDPYLFETSVPGIFAAGDVRATSGKRVAAAVGEGSGTVSMVHRYLETV